MAKSDDFDNYDKLEIDGQSGFPQLLQVSPITSVISGRFPSNNFIFSGGNKIVSVEPVRVKLSL